MIKHIVFWKISPAGDSKTHKAVVAQFREKTEYLKSIIPEIVEAAVGYNYVEGDVFNVCIDSLFKTPGDLATYINHPEHLKIREFMNSVTYDKTVFDYEC